MSFELLSILAVVTFVSAFIQGSLGIGFALIVAPVGQASVHAVGLPFFTRS